MTDLPAASPAGTLPLSVAQLAKVCREWGPRSFVCFYEWVTGFSMPMHMYPVVLGLCDTRIQKLMLWIGPGGGKSMALSQVYPAWVIGHDPQTTFMTISAAEHLAEGFQGAVSEFIEYSEAFRLAFPGVRPDKEKGWSNERGLFVTGRRQGDPDPSYGAYGIASKALTGKHARSIVFDDLHDAMNSATIEQCDNLERIYISNLLGRADAKGARYVMAGRRWNENDLLGRLYKNGDWITLRLPFERRDSGGKLYHDIYVPEDPRTGKPIACVYTDGMMRLGNGEYEMAQASTPKSRRVSIDGEPD